MAEHAGHALWELYGLLHGLKTISTDAAVHNRIHDGLVNLDMISVLIRVPAPEGAALTQMIPHFNIPSPVAPGASVPVGGKTSGKSFGGSKSKVSPALLREAIDLCNEILGDMENMPDQASEFAASCEEKAKSVKAQAENGYVSEKQLSMLTNIRAGQRKWIDNAYDS